MGQNRHRWQCREDIQRHWVEGEKCRKRRDGWSPSTSSCGTLHWSVFPSVIWQLGWSIGPEHLIKHLQTVMQNTLYTCPTPLQASALLGLSSRSVRVQSNCPGSSPLQEAVAQGLLHNLELMGRPDCYFSSLSEELEGKRDRLAAILRDAGMTPVVPEGGYFMLVDVTPLSEPHIPFTPPLFPSSLCKFHPTQTKSRASLRPRSGPLTHWRRGRSL